VSLSPRLLIIALVFVAVTHIAIAEPAVTGQRKKWHNVTLTFDGPATSEGATPNPFTDYCLTVTFSQGEKKVVVPGYYAADGRAGETGAAKGTKWRVHFVPEATGTWAYVASFRGGRNVVLSDDPKAGKPAAFDGTSGQLRIAPSDKTGRDFRAKGFLRHVGGHYLRFAETGEHFLKGGADSPENFLGYADFDGTFDTGKSGRQQTGGFLHKYAPHVKDWRPGDPTWRGGKGKGIIGALNYLASTGMNSVYFIPYNIDGGDGKDTWPWTSPKERMRFDCSKLDQWEIVFSHMDSLGLALHPITQETENDQGLDGGELGPQRKLYYRELIARFAHHLAITWNLGEENTNTDAQRKAFCTYVRGLDPYDHAIVCHTFPGRYDQVYSPLLGFGPFDGPSLQTGNARITHAETIKWVVRSALAGRRWFVCHDEAGPANTGIKPDKDDPDHDDVRRYPLWGNLMAGGAGCEWYFGYKYAHNDLNCEDWRSRANMWAQTRHALEFFHKHLPFWAMRTGDELTDARDDYCFYSEGKIYAIYLPRGGATALTVPDNTYTVRWYNPRKGGSLRDGTVKTFQGAGKHAIGEPPAEKNKDWVALVRGAGAWHLGANAPLPTFTQADARGLPKPARGGGSAKRRRPKRTGKPPVIEGFALIDADKDRPIGAFDPLADGAMIDLSRLPTRKLNVIARTSGDVDSVTFTLDGKRGKTEGTAPYALAGDRDGDYGDWTPPAGTHKLTAVARGPGGATSKPLTVTFKVIDGPK